MSKFILGVTEGVAMVYPYGQGSDVSKVLVEGEALLLQVPVGPHPEPNAAPDTQMAKAWQEALKDMAEEDVAAPAAGVDNDSPPGKRAGTLMVMVAEGKVTLRTYEGSLFTEQELDEGGKASVEVTESNRVTIAVYDAAPYADPRK